MEVDRSSVHDLKWVNVFFSVLYFIYMLALLQLLELSLSSVNSVVPMNVLQVLSRAFRNRFVELHFDEIPSGELVEILQKRCQLPQSYSQLLVKVMLELQVYAIDVCFISVHCYLM